MRSPLPFRRPLVRVAMVSLAGASLVWALWLVVFGGFDVTVVGVRIRSRDPRRLVMIAGLASIGFFLAGGTIPLTALLTRVRAWPAALARRPGSIALGLAALSVLVAVVGSTRIAGGSDAYGYISQADLWIDGNLRVPQPWVKQVPWPNPEWTFTPLGYRPVEHNGEWSIVPTYSPGLPMLMGGMKLVSGQCGLFAVTPLLAGLAVLATYGLGRRLGSPPTGLAGAWFLATSPIVVGDDGAADRRAGHDRVGARVLFPARSERAFGCGRRPVRRAGDSHPAEPVPARCADGGVVPRPPHTPGPPAGNNRPPGQSDLCRGIFGLRPARGRGRSRSSTSTCMDRPRLRDMAAWKISSP